MAIVLTKSELRIFNLIHRNSLLNQKEVESRLMIIFEEMDNLIDMNSALYYIAYQLNLDIDTLLNQQLSNEKEDDHINLTAILIKIKEKYAWDKNNFVRSIIVEDKNNLISIAFWNQNIKILDEMIEKGMRNGNLLLLENLHSHRKTNFENPVFNLTFGDKAHLEII